MVNYVPWETPLLCRYQLSSAGPIIWLEWSDGSRRVSVFFFLSIGLAWIYNAGWRDWRWMYAMGLFKVFLKDLLKTVSVFIYTLHFFSKCLGLPLTDSHVEKQYLGGCLVAKRSHQPQNPTTFKLGLWGRRPYLNQHGEKVLSHWGLTYSRYCFTLRSW